MGFVETHRLLWKLWGLWILGLYTFIQSPFHPPPRQWLGMVGSYILNGLPASPLRPQGMQSYQAPINQATAGEAAVLILYGRFAGTPQLSV